MNFQNEVLPNIQTEVKNSTVQAISNVKYSVKEKHFVQVILIVVFDYNIANKIFVSWSDETS